MTVEIKLLVPDLPTADELLPFLRQIDQNRWYTNFGPLNREFEHQLGRHIAPDGNMHVTSVSDCTAGLELVLNALGLKPGDGVLLPGLTFVATATAVLRAGYRPVVADVDADNWLLTPEIARAALAQADIKAVMPVSTFGATQNTAAWDVFMEETGIPVVIDAAGAFGNQPVGRLCAMVFSLHATKALGIGEGGAVLSSDATLVEKVRVLSNFGLEWKTGLVLEAGTNAKLSEYHAAVGLAALKRWPSIAGKRRKLQADYLAGIRQRGIAVQFQQKNYEEGVYPTFPVAVSSEDKALQLRQGMADVGIETRKWYCPPIHRHPGLAIHANALDTPVCDELAGRLVGLPFHTSLSAQDVATVLDNLQRLLA